MSKLSIKQISWEKDNMNSRLEFDIKGVNHTIVNTFRRIILTNIPIYSFNNITISENTSVFNNNYMKLRISNMPVFGIAAENPIFTPPKKTIVKEDVGDVGDIDINVNYGSNDDVVNSSSLKLLTMYVDYVNKTNEIITVGTDDCKFYFAEKQIPSPYSINIPIIKLQTKQKIKLSAITELGIEETSSIYSPVSIFTYKKIAEDNYIVTIESRGQLDEKKIFQYAHDNIKMMLDNFLQLIPDKEDISGKLLMTNADHTIGNLISEGLQEHKKVKFAGYNSPHLLDKKIVFHYELTEKMNIKDIITEIVKDYIELFYDINKKIQDNIN
jgi:DNA-directed RNA polymerase subunit L